MPRAATLPYAMQGEAPSFTSGAGGVAGGTSSPFASASGDVDGDGNVDLFVANKPKATIAEKTTGDVQVDVEVDGVPQVEHGAKKPVGSDGADVTA